MERFEERRRLIENLKRLGYIRSKKVEDAMMSIRREDFVPQGLREYAYHDTPLLERAGIRNVEVVEGDGSMGLPEHAPYDRILVTCSAPDIPDPLVEQLKDGGIILIPVGRTFSVLVKGLKRGNRVVRKEICGCAFVPLIGKYGF